jgi:fermentation-respiration switch protein FrsA (DUF1100 family)
MEEPVTHEARRTRSWPRRTVYGLLAFVVVFHLGGGWYFSGLIRSDGLEPRGPQPNFGVRVVELDGSSIVLDGTDRRAIEHAGVFRLWWDGGYGEVGAITSTEGELVTRGFSLVDGSPPPTCSSADLAQCPDVDLEGFVYPSDPSDVGLTFEEVAYQSPLGEMGGWQVPPTSEDTGVWAIQMHGWRTERRETVRMLPTYAEAGITSLVIDFRNDPGAPPDPSGLYRFGRTEWQDAEAAVEYALGEGATGIILAGYSTGATAEMAFLENSAAAGSVIGVVWDAPNLDFGRAVSAEASERTIPGTPIPLPPTLTAVAKWIADLRFDVDWDAINYVDRADVLAVPTLIFHGAGDETVPVSVSEDVAAANPTYVTLVIKEEADHVLSWNVDPEDYTSKLGAFLLSLTSG